MSLQNNVNLHSSQRYKSTLQQLQNNLKTLYFNFLDPCCCNLFSNVNMSLENNVDLQSFLHYKTRLQQP